MAQAVPKSIARRFEELSPMQRSMLVNRIDEDTFDNLATSAMSFIQSEMAGLKTFIRAWMEDGGEQAGM